MDKSNKGGIRSDDVCKILVGNKTDLESNREITEHQGRTKAEKHRALFAENSCTDL